MHSRLRWRWPIVVVVLWAFLVCCACLAAFVADDHDAVSNELSDHKRAEDVPGRFQRRSDLLDHVCTKYTDAFRPESAALNRQSVCGFGSEVVFLFGQAAKLAKHKYNKPAKDVASVCIPHKVGSNSWGKFSKVLQSELDQAVVQSDWLELKWEEKAKRTRVRAVVVRHPMERLISVYRMIFEHWCDKDRFLAKQWHNVCGKLDSGQGSASGSGSGSGSGTSRRKGGTPLENAVSNSDFNVGAFFASMLEEHQHGNDRFIQSIWKKFHPEETLSDPDRQLRFTFREFARFLVNGTQEFGPNVAGHQGLAYHWAPFWKECSLCSSQTRPHLVLHMETLQEDLELLLARVGLDEQLAGLFPHTHHQKGGHSSRPQLMHKYFSTLTKSEVWQLYEKYRLDHELFGYDVQPYLDVALDEEEDTST